MKKKKLLYIAGGVGAVLAITLLVVPPFLLSSDWLRSLILHNVNKGMPGELSAQHCSIGWQQGAVCSGVLYNDTTQGIQLDVTELRLNRGLWSLLNKPEDLGELVFNEPKLLLTVKAPAAKSPPPARANQVTPTISGQPVEKAGAQESSKSFLSKMKGRLLIHNAAIRVAQGKEPAKLFLSNGALQADISANQVTFDLTASSGQQGKAEARGTAKLTELVHGDLAGADMQLQLTHVQAQPFLALNPGVQGLPQGNGTLSADIKVIGAADGSLTVSGPASLTEVDLSGGVLGTDHPRFSQLAVDLEAQQENNDWQLPSLKAVSDFGSLNLQSTKSGGGFQASGEGKIDLALLLAQFPHLLKIRDDLRLDRGELTITAHLAKDGDQLHISADAAVDSLAGRQNGGDFAWDSPLSVHLVGSLANQAPEVESLRLSAPFLDLEGRGNLQQFSLDGKADVDAAMREVNRIFRFDWDAGGKVQVQVQLAKDGNEHYQIDAKADIADSRLSHKGKEILPPCTTSFSGKLSTPGHIPESGKNAAELTFNLSSWPGTISGTLDGLYRKNGKISSGYQVQAKLMLGRFVELLHKFEAINPELSLAGDLDLNASGYTEDNRVVLRDVDSRIKDFILYRNGKVIRDPDLRLSTLRSEDGQTEQVRPLIKADSRSSFFADGGGCSLLDPTAHRLILRDLEFASGFADFKLHLLSLDDWQHKPMPALRTLQVQGESQLEKLADLLRQVEVIPPEQKLGGAATFAIDLAEQSSIPGSAASAGSSGTVAIDLDRFFYGKEGNILAAKEKVEFRSRLHGDLAAGDIYFTNFDLQSYPLSMQSSGRLELTGQTPNLSLEGVATPDFAAVVAVLNGMYPLDISAAGRKKEKFTFYYPLTGKRQAELKFAARFHADSFVKSGIKISDLSADTGMKEGVMSTAFQGILNGGTVQLSPKIDYTQDPPLLSLPKPEQILTKVGLADTLTNGLLKSIHPLLGALARPAGIISLKAERFSMPIGAKGIEKADFNLHFDLASVVLEPTSALAGILDIAGLGGHPLNLKEKTLNCEGRKGRISCSPIKITVAGSEMTLSGSAGFDGSLDYVVEVPVTKNLVGKKGYELLKGATLKVPIKGTKDRPVYNPEALMQAASDLLGQAAGHAAKKAVQEQVEKIVPKEVLPALPGLLDGFLGR